MNRLLLNIAKQIKETEKLVREMKSDLTDIVKDLSPDVNFSHVVELSEKVLVLDLDGDATVNGDVVITTKTSALSGLEFIEYARIEK